MAVEGVALLLLRVVLAAEADSQPTTDRSYILNAYAECSEAAQGNRPERSL